MNVAKRALAFVFLIASSIVLPTRALAYRYCECDPSGCWHCADSDFAGTSCGFPRPCDEATQVCLTAGAGPVCLSAEPIVCFPGGCRDKQAPYCNGLACFDQSGTDGWYRICGCSCESRAACGGGVLDAGVGADAGSGETDAGVATTTDAATPLPDSGTLVRPDGSIAGFDASMVVPAAVPHGKYRGATCAIRRGSAAGGHAAVVVALLLVLRRAKRRALRRAKRPHASLACGRSSSPFLVA